MKNPDSIKAFGSNLRKIRDENKISQQELADIANLNKKTIQRIELAKINPSLDTIICIAKAFNMEIKDLFDF